MEPTNPRSNFGGPDELPPLSGTDPEPDDLDGQKLYKVIRNVMVIFFVFVAIGVFAALGYLISSASKDAKHPEQTMTIPLPAVPTGLPKLTAKQICPMIPALFVLGESTKAAALRDLSSGQIDLPSVSQSELTALIVQLQTLEAQAPQSLAPNIAAYLTFYLRLWEIKSGVATGQASSIESTKAAADINATCRKAAN